MVQMSSEFLLQKEYAVRFYSYIFCCFYYECLLLKKNIKINGNCLCRMPDYVGLSHLSIACFRFVSTKSNLFHSRLFEVRQYVLNVPLNKVINSRQTYRSESVCREMCRNVATIQVPISMSAFRLKDPRQGFLLSTDNENEFYLCVNGNLTLGNWTCCIHVFGFFTIVRILYWYHISVTSPQFVQKSPFSLLRYKLSMDSV